MDKEFLVGTVALVTIILGIAAAVTYIHINSPAYTLAAKCIERNGTPLPLSGNDVTCIYGRDRMEPTK